MDIYTCIGKQPRLEGYSGAVPVGLGIRSPSWDPC